MEKKTGDTMNPVLTTLIILVASVILGTGVVLYGASLFENQNQQHISIVAFEKGIPHSGCPDNLDICMIQFYYKIFDTQTNKTFTLKETNMTVYIFENHGGLARFLGTNDNRMLAIPNDNGSLYIAIDYNSSKYFLASGTTGWANHPFFSGFDLKDIIGNGNVMFTYNANLNDIKNKMLDHADGDIWKIPITIGIFMTNDTGTISNSECIKQKIELDTNGIPKPQLCILVTERDALNP